MQKKLIAFILSLHKAGKLPPVDLRECQKGDKLLTCCGLILTYNKKVESFFYPHIILYPDKSEGSRADGGQAYLKNTLPTDQNVIAVLK